MPLFRRHRRYWDSHWGVYPIFFDERPAVVTVDLGAVDAGPVAELPVRLVVRLDLGSTDDNGLPTLEETASLFAAEARITAAVEKSWAGRSVGRYLSGGQAVLCYHLPDDPGDPAAVLQGKVTAPYAARASVAADAGWDYVRDMLAPGPVERAWILNEELLTEREAQRDRLDLPRRVDHAALLPSVDAARAAADALRDLRYVPTDPRPIGDQWLLEFSRDDTVDIDSANTFTAEIVRVVTAHGGEYDGWAAPVVS